MNLTAERVAEFVGGDMEIQNQTEDYILRGPIKTARVENGSLRVSFEWIAKNNGGPSAPTREWTGDERTDYAVSLDLCRVLEINKNRIVLTAPFADGELITLFPPDGSKLAQSQVGGLGLVST